MISGGKRPGGCHTCKKTAAEGTSDICNATSLREKSYADSRSEGSRQGIGMRSNRIFGKGPLEVW